MQERLSQIQTDSPKQLSFPHTNTAFYTGKFMLFCRWHTFFFFLPEVFASQCRMQNGM